MRAYRASVFALVALTRGTVPAEAQEAEAVEVTPYIALGSAAASPVGVAVAFPVTPSLSIEADAAYRRGEGDIHALSMSTSLLWLLPRVGRASPYLAAGVGLSQYGAPVFASNAGPPVGTQGRLAITANLGGGVKMPMNERMDLRTDVRWMESFGRQGQTEQFRVSQGVSFDVGRR